MAVILFSIFLLISPFPIFGKTNTSTQSAATISTGAYLEKIKTASKPIGVLTNSGAPKKVVVHLFWATWCEYCDQVIASILGMSKEKGFSQLQINSYSFDEKPLTPENEKVSKMKSFNNFQTAFKPNDLPETLSRLPVTIVEDTEKKTFRVYTGFSNERFRILKKYINRLLNNPDIEG